MKSDLVQTTEYFKCPYKSWEFNQNEERECYCDILGGYPNYCCGKYTKEDVEKCIKARKKAADNELHGRED